MINSWTTEGLGARSINLDRRRIPVRSSDRKPGPYPYYGASGVVDHVDGFLFDGLHLLVAEDGENLRSRNTPVAFLADGKFWVNNHAHILTANDANDTRYLSYALEAVDLSGYLTGSAQPKLTQAALASIPVPAPGRDEQRRIGATLGALDNKIESNRRTIQTASDLLDALSAGASDTLAGVRLGDLVTVARTAIDPKAFADRQVDHFSLPAFDQGARPERVRASTIMSGKLAVTMPSILVSLLNPRFNRTWWAVPNEGVPALASTEFACLTTDTREDLAAVWLAVRDEYFRAELVRRASGTSGSHQRVRPDDLLAIDVPDVRELSNSTKVEAHALIVLIHGHRIESAKLARLRDTLLPELLSGRIRVPEARDALAETAASV